MSFSDDEEELLPESVSNYYFVDEKEEPVSFCVLPFRWQDDQNVDACKKQVFLHGVGDDGLQKIYKQATEWKLELEGFRPVVFVLSKDQKWLQLSKSRKSYEDMIRKILVTIHCLHYLRNNSESSEKSLWDHLKKEFSHFEVRPSRTDLQDHLPFFREFSQRDEAFAKCQLLPGLIDGASKNKPGSEDMMDTKNSDFINDEEDDQNDDGGNVNEDEADSDEEQDCFDSVCAICDNGGELTVYVIMVRTLVIAALLIVSHHYFTMLSCFKLTSIYGSHYKPFVPYSILMRGPKETSIQIPIAGTWGNFESTSTCRRLPGTRCTCWRRD